VPRIKSAMEYCPKNSFSISCTSPSSCKVIFPGAATGGKLKCLMERLQMTAKGEMLQRWRNKQESDLAKFAMYKMKNLHGG